MVESTTTATVEATKETTVSRIAELNTAMQAALAKGDVDEVMKLSKELGGQLKSQETFVQEEEKDIRAEFAGTMSGNFTDLETKLNDLGASLKLTYQIDKEGQQSVHIAVNLSEALTNILTQLAYSGDKPASVKTWTFDGDFSGEDMGVSIGGSSKRVNASTTGARGRGWMPQGGGDTVTLTQAFEVIATVDETKKLKVLSEIADAKERNNKTTQYKTSVVKGKYLQAE